MVKNCWQLFRFFKAILQYPGTRLEDLASSTEQRMLVYFREKDDSCGLAKYSKRYKQKMVSFSVEFGNFLYQQCYRAPKSQLSKSSKKLSWSIHILHNTYKGASIRSAIENRELDHMRLQESSPRKNTFI